MFKLSCIYALATRMTALDQYGLNAGTLWLIVYFCLCTSSSTIENTLSCYSGFIFMLSVCKTLVIVTCWPKMNRLSITTCLLAFSFSNLWENFVWCCWYDWKYPFVPQWAYRNNFVIRYHCQCHQVNSSWKETPMLLLSQNVWLYGKILMLEIFWQ